MLKLGVNIDHVATLRQARYRGCEGGEPDPVTAALAAEEAGAHGITAHLREDRRHIIDSDIRRLREQIRTRLNFEMAITPEIVAFALAIRPDIVCLVPENRQEVTTEGGLDVAGNLAAIQGVCRRMAGAGVAVSLFIDPDPAQVAAAAGSGAGFIELHTGVYAGQFHQERERNVELGRLARCSAQAHDLGLRVNAGHGLNVTNVPWLHGVPHLEELNIGHTLISRAILVGLNEAVKEMLAAMAGYPG